MWRMWKREGVEVTRKGTHLRGEIAETGQTSMEIAIYHAYSDNANQYKISDYT